MAKRPKNQNPKSGRGPHNRRPLSPGGGGPTGYKGGGPKGGGKSSSSVHDGVRILVVGIASAVVLIVAGVAAFLISGYVTA